MPKAAKKLVHKPVTAPATALRARRVAVTNSIPKKKGETTSKQSRIITMLKSSDGTTIAAMMKATGWQQHSVRGLLAGVVRKKLKLKLNSNKVDGKRVYRVIGAAIGNPRSTQPRHRSA